MTTQDLINTLRQGKPMTDRLMREIVRELEEKTEQVHTMGTALRAKDADYAALREAVRPVAKSYVTAKDHAVWDGKTIKASDEAFPEVTVAQMDALAKLVGEEVG